MGRPFSRTGTPDCYCVCVFAGPKTADGPTAQLYGRSNDAYPAASDAVSVEYAETEGRHAVAGRDVPVGKVLLVERAYASVLLPEYWHTHCTECFTKCVISANPGKA